jgi:RluA family pseudouridine synthase
MKRTLPYTILHEDDDLIVVDKAAGLTVIADRWDDSAEHLDDLLNERFAPGRVFVVHRIDRDTSGLVVFAKNAETHRALSAAFESRRVGKTYILAVHGIPAWKETVCELQLRQDGDRDHRTVIDKSGGKRAVTAFRLLGAYGHVSLLEAKPETGRTHQIRVHAAAIGHPIIADRLYGDGRPLRLSSFKRGWRGDPWEEKPLIDRLALHAAALELPPRSAAGSAPGTAALALSAPFPRDMAAVVRQLEKAANEDFGLSRFH